MTSEQTLAYESLSDWENLGQLPDQEAFDAAYKELESIKRLAERYRKFIDECQLNENCRHLPPLSSQHSSEESVREGNFD